MESETSETQSKSGSSATPRNSAEVVGVLLAGGQSRRMFEPAGTTGDKGLLDIGGKPMLAHVIDRLRPQVGQMVLNANGDASRFERFGLPVVPDPVGGFAGPLAGVLAGLRWAEANAAGATHIATVSTDAPFIPSDLVERLARALTPEKPISIAQSNGELHPVIGLWPIALADDLEAALRGGTRKVLAWTDGHGTCAADFPLVEIGAERVDPFFNANTPDDIEEAQRLLAVQRRA